MPAPVPHIDDPPDLPVDNNLNGNDNDNGTSSSSSSSSSDEGPDLPIAMRRAPRNRKPPGEWWKIPRKPKKPPLPSSNEEDEGEDNDDDGDELEEANALTISEPLCYMDALKTPEARHWKEAALEEMNAHLENQT